MGKGERLTYGSGNGGTLVASAKGQGKGGKNGGVTSEQQKQQQLQQLEQQQHKGSYTNSIADLGGGDAGKQPVYKPARSGPWVRCQCPTCPGYTCPPSNTSRRSKLGVFALAAAQSGTSPLPCLSSTGLNSSKDDGAPPS